MIFFTHSSLSQIKDYCLLFIVKDDNFQDIVMSAEFNNMDKELIVDVIRRRVTPSKNIGDFKCEKGLSKLILNYFFFLLLFLLF